MHSMKHDRAHVQAHPLCYHRTQQRCLQGLLSLASHEHIGSQIHPGSVPGSGKAWAVSSPDVAADVRVKNLAASAQKPACSREYPAKLLCCLSQAQDLSSHKRCSASEQP